MKNKNQNCFNKLNNYNFRLREILLKEEQLSLKYPINKVSLEKIQREREFILKEIEKITCELIDLGEVLNIYYKNRRPIKYDFSKK